MCNIKAAEQPVKSFNYDGEISKIEYVAGNIMTILYTIHLSLSA